MPGLTAPDAAADRGDDFTPTDDVDTKTPDTKAVELTADDKKLADNLRATGEPKVDETKADEDKGDDKGRKDTRIPLSRHEELLNKERSRRQELEQQLAQYQKGDEVANVNARITEAETALLKLEKEYAQLITDGDADKAALKMAEIRRLDREITTSQSDMKIAAAEARATERARFNIALERIEREYDVLNPESDKHDADVEQDVIDLKATYERRGLTPTDALQKAVKKLLGATTTRQEAAVEVTPRVPAKDVAAERKTAALEKTIATVNAQPASLAKIGMDTDKAGGGVTAKDVIKMSYKDFAKLPEEQRAAMRGDLV